MPEYAFIYPGNFAETSDLSRVLEVISGFCHSPTGKNKIVGLQMFSSAIKITQFHAPIKEVLKILDSGFQLPVLDFLDNSEDVANLRVQGWVIDTENLQALKIVLILMNQLNRFVEEHHATEHLKDICNQAVFHNHLHERAKKILDEDGNIKDNASDELHRLRKENIRQTKDIEKRLMAIFKDLKIAGIAGEETNMTIRNGRSVIPVPANSKYKVRGIIHDESATGQTAYIEPMEIVEMGNKLRENHSAQQREIRRILAEISTILHDHVDDVMQYYKILAEMDACFAKARFAVQYHAVFPEIDNKPVIDWKQARNLILQINLEKQKKKVIPLSIRLGEESSMLVLSGANAGGKSIVIKTVALIQAMIQCGLPVTIDETSKAGVFTSMFFDIGDGQSIENNLSTYSSHLEIMKVFISKAGKESLYLIDEIGSGTDPVLGGSLAQAILMHLHRKGAIGIVTTHLDMLKKMADETPGASNAAMVFDTERLQPSYVLRAGIPGNSFTFEIAARTGIPSEIIDVAKTFAGDERITFEQKISDVEKKSEQLLDSLKKQKMAEEFLDGLVSKYTSLIEKTEKQQSEIVLQTRLEAAEIISKANKAIENTIRTIKEAAAEKNITKEVRKEAEKVLSEISHFEPSKKIEGPLKQKVQQIAESKKKTEKQVSYVQGMIVKHIANGMEGRIIEIMPDNKLKVAFQSVAMTIDSSQLTPLEKNQSQKRKSISIRTDVQSKTGNFERTLDLRGFKAEQVMYSLEKHIDDALLIGIYDFSVLHGKGFGVLRNVVRQLLAKHPNVEGFESEHVDRGGDGITLVRLKR